MNSIIYVMCEMHEIPIHDQLLSSETDKNVSMSCLSIYLSKIRSCQAKLHDIQTKLLLFFFC